MFGRILRVDAYSASLTRWLQGDKISTYWDTKLLA